MPSRNRPVSPPSPARSLMPLRTLAPHACGTFQGRLSPPHGSEHPRSSTSPRGRRFRNRPSRTSSAERTRCRTTTRAARARRDRAAELQAERHRPPVRQARTTMIGVLVGDLGQPYHAQMSRVVERAALRRGYTAMFCNIEGDDDLATAGVDALLEQRVAGCRVPRATSSGRRELDGSLRQTDVPIVVDRAAPGAGATRSVRATARAEGWPRGTCSTSATGASAYVRTPRSRPAATAPAHAGYRPRCATAGCRADGAAVVGARLGRRSASAAGRCRCDDALSGPDAPTALFVSNDIGAIGLIEACEAAGIRSRATCRSSASTTSRWPAWAASR